MVLKSWLKNKYVWIIIVVLILISRISVGYFSKTVKIYTTSKVRNYAEDLIAQCVEEKILKELESSDLFIENYDSNGKVSYAYVDSVKINKIRNNMILYTDQAIMEINKHQDFDSIQIPLSYLFGVKYFFAHNLRVPIQLEVIGNQNIELRMNTLSKGINTTIIELYLNVSIDIQVVIPLQSETTVTSCKIPLAIEVMNNEIPYYLGDFFN